MLVLALFVIVPLVVGLGLSAIQKIYEMSLQEKVVTPIWIQNGYIPDAALEKQISPRPYVPTTQEALNELWTGLKLPGKSPTIDFSRLLVIVLTDRGANIPQATYIVDSWGNLRMTSRISTLIGGPGFGYSIHVFERQGIRELTQPINRPEPGGPPEHQPH